MFEKEKWTTVKFTVKDVTLAKDAHFTPLWSKTIQDVSERLKIPRASSHLGYTMLISSCCRSSSLTHFLCIFCLNQDTLKKPPYITFPSSRDLKWFSEYPQTLWWREVRTYRDHRLWVDLSCFSLNSLRGWWGHGWLIQGCSAGLHHWFLEAAWLFQNGLICSQPYEET